MQILEFIFSSGWHFFGTLLLIGVTGTSAAEVIRAARHQL